MLKLTDKLFFDHATRAGTSGELLNLGIGDYLTINVGKTGSGSFSLRFKGMVGNVPYDNAETESWGELAIVDLSTYKTVSGNRIISAGNYFAVVKGVDKIKAEIVSVDANTAVTVYGKIGDR